MSERADARVNVTITGTTGHVDQSQLAGLIRRLAAKHGDQFSASAVAQCVRRCVDELLRAGIRSGLLPATEAMAGARLRLRPPLLWDLVDACPDDSRRPAGAGAIVPARAAARTGRPCHGRMDLAPGDRRGRQSAGWSGGGGRAGRRDPRERWSGFRGLGRAFLVSARPGRHRCVRLA